MRLHPRTRRRLLPLLAVALLWLQALGLWHHVVHGVALEGPVAAVSASAHDADGHGGDHGDHGLADHDAGDPQCRLYDQLAHADLAPGSAGTAPVLAVGGTPLAATPAGRLAPQAAGFLARGPPPAA